MLNATGHKSCCKYIGECKAGIIQYYIFACKRDVDYYVMLSPNYPSSPIAMYKDHITSSSLNEDNNYATRVFYNTVYNLIRESSEE